MRLQKQFNPNEGEELPEKQLSLFSYEPTAEIDYERMSLEFGLHHSYLEFIAKQKGLLGNS